MLLKVNLESAGYGQGAVLREIRFDLPQGRILALIGPNGCGKTTLIRAISGVLPEVNGDIFINGTDLTNALRQDQARLVAVVPQSTHIPPAFQVEDVIQMGRTPFLNWMGNPTDSDRLAVQKAMHQTDVIRLARRYCGELSAGERQRVILARALAQDTPVLLMDEPTSHLDLRYQIEFLELTLELAMDAGKTVMIALHDLNLAARFGDEIIAMKDGRLAARGGTREILQDQIIREIYGLEVQVFPSPKNQQLVILPK